MHLGSNGQISAPVIESDEDTAMDVEVSGLQPNHILHLQQISLQTTSCLTLRKMNRSCKFNPLLPQSTVPPPVLMPIVLPLLQLLHPLSMPLLCHHTECHPYSTRCYYPQCCCPC